MTNLTSAGIFPAKIPVGSLPGLYGGQGTDVTLTPGLTALVGPNGLGKSQVLRLVRDNLRNSLSGLIGKYVRYLSSGRGSPFEQYRAAITNPSHIESGPAAVGHASFRDQWWAIESVVGDFLALERRADLRLKVQARVQQLLGRSIELAWTQAGLQPTISSRAGGAPYNANVEASGVLQLVPLLAATYNDEISALLIDEPEISLHPQHQSFLLDELRSVAGDPYADPRKKLVVFATHSPTMLPIRTISEIPTIVFFNHQDRPPVQVRPETGELQRRKLAALTARMGATHRLAFFAESVLLVEGPSDETVVTQLARRLELSLGAANTQILPVVGKGEFIEAAKLFGLIGKRVTLLADLDALVDSNEIVLFFGARLECAAAAAAAGHSDVAGLDGKLRTDFNQLIVAEWTSLAPTAEAQRYWTTCPERERTETTRRRAVLSVLLADGPEAFGQPDLSGRLSALRARFEALFGILAAGGCYFLRRGAIEEYFATIENGSSKPAAAAEEAASFDDVATEALAARYKDVLSAINHAGQLKRVDETELLRERLGAAVGAMLQSMTKDHTAAELDARARGVIRSDADIFSFENASTSKELRLRVRLRSRLFSCGEFPFEVSENENATQVIRRQIPPQS